MSFRRLIIGSVLGVALAFPAHALASASEESMVAAINEARQERGLPGLRTSPLLSESAASYSRYMIARDYFGHLAEVRTSDRFSLKGEVLAWYTGSAPRVGATVRSWMRSPSHRSVLLHPRMRWVGAGVERGNLDGRFCTVWTVQVGRM